MCCYIIQHWQFAHHIKHILCSEVEVEPTQTINEVGVSIWNFKRPFYAKGNQCWSLWRRFSTLYFTQSWTTPGVISQICFTYPQCNVELQKYFLKSFSPHATSLLNLSHKSPVRVQQEGGVLPFLDHLWSNHAGSQVLCLHLFSSQFQFLVLNFEATLPTTGILSFNTNLEMSSWTRTSSLHYGSANMRTGREGREDPISLSEFMDFIKIVVGRNKGKQQKLRILLIVMFC